MAFHPDSLDFNNHEHFKAHRGDLELWGPHVEHVLAQHGLEADIAPPVAGYNSTYPTFICGDVVLKFFGYKTQWRKSFEAERAALRLVSADPEIAAPSLLADGYLVDGEWAYLVTERVPGAAVWRAGLTPEQQRVVAADLGRQIERIHALQPSDDIFTHAQWDTIGLTEALRLSSLPEHLIEQADDYVAALGPPDPVFINADIVANHVYVERGRLVGIIDWGDALVADRHIELIQIYRDLFDCDTSLLQVFLEASNWPVDKRFPRKAMGYALQRQALMRAQHDGGDAFEPIAEKFPLDEIATLDELAEVLFRLR